MKESKRADASTKAVVWGSEVDGVVGVISVPPQKVVELVRLTVDVLAMGHTNYRVLARLVGSWNPVLMHACAAFSIL